MMCEGGWIQNRGRRDAFTLQLIPQALQIAGLEPLHDHSLVSRSHKILGKLIRGSGD